METIDSVLTPVARRAGRKLGYAIAVIVNLVLIFIVHNIAGWDWFRFLTPEFQEVIPWLSVALWLSAGANLLYFVYDDSTTRHIGQIVVNIFNLIATIVFLRVFPFDFTGYSFDWSTVVRVVLVVGIVGTGVGMITEFVQLAKGRAGVEKEASDADGI